MKFKNPLLLLLLVCLVSQSVAAQYNRISKQLDVAIFPNDGQSRVTQKQDENVCYDWAYDQEDRVERRAGAVEDEKKKENRAFLGKVTGGAVAGTLIGALTGNTKRGLLIGAAGGAVYGAGEKAEKQYQRDVEQRHKNEVFIKNFSACMKSKDYSVER